MRNLIHYVLCVIILLTVLTSCNIFAEEPVPSGAIIMADDFMLDEGNWLTTLDPDSSMVGYQAEGLRFVINAPNKDYFSLYKTPYANAIIDVDMTKLAGPDNNVMGIVCRYQDLNNYYGFIISADGYYGIISKVNGSYHVLPEGQLFYNDEVINTGHAANHVRVGCVQTALWLEINNVNVMGLYDSNLTDGKVGLMAGSLADPGVDVLFDNFSVIQP